MITSDETGTSQRSVLGIGGEVEPVPALLVAYAPGKAINKYKFEIRRAVVVGRDEGCDIEILNKEVSRRHFRIFERDGRHIIEDLGSKNGTFVGGKHIRKAEKLEDQVVIRAGQAILVFHMDASGLRFQPQSRTRGFVGRFHSARITDEIAECTKSSRHLLLAGPTGSGKEVAARTFGEIAGKAIVAHNAARFSS